MRKMIYSVCLLLTAVSIVLIKEYSISAQDNNRPVVVLDGELVYEDTLNRGDTKPERVKKELPATETKCIGGVCSSPNMPIVNIIPAVGEVVQIPASAKEVKTAFVPIAPQSEIKVVASDSDFTTEVESCKGVVLVDFWAPWCGHCTRFMPVVESVMPGYSGMVKFTKANVDICSSTARKYGITSLPCVLIFKDGVSVGNHIGAMSDPDLRIMIDKFAEKGSSRQIEGSETKVALNSFKQNSNRRIVILDGHPVYEDTLNRPSSEVERVEPEPTKEEPAEVIDLDDSFAEIVNLPETKSRPDIDFFRPDSFFSIKNQTEIKWPFDLKTK